jgi:hypothetical protein
MTVGRILGILILSSLAATGTALAGGISKGSGAKADHALPTNGPASSARHARPQAPIVMGRSVSEHHKTKLHHIKIKPPESIDTAVSTDNSR